jgi:A1 cistron-splicing factor AAR2
MMSNDEALFRFKQGGALLALDVPEGTEFGIDCTVFTVGPKFQGVKMIPPGLHLALVGAAGNEATRVAEVLWLERSDVRVRRWDPASEAFHPGSGMDEDAEERYRLGVRNHDFDATMGPYPTESHAQWLRLTSRVTRATLSRCGAGAGERLAPGDPDAARDADGRPLLGTGNGSHLSGGVVPYFPGLARQPTFRDVASRAPRGASPSEVSLLGSDPSRRLRRAIETCGGDWRELVGESQVAFVLFLMLGSMSAFEHWKAVTHMVCDASEDASGSNLELYGDFAGALARQLERASEDFFADQLAEENFLAPALEKLIRGMERGTRGRAGGAARETARRAKNLRAFCRRRFGLEFEFDGDEKVSGEGDDERGMRPGSNDKASSSGPCTVVHGDLEEGEDAPVVVELSEGTYARMEAEDDEGDAAETETETSAAEEAPQERMGWMMG